MEVELEVETQLSQRPTVEANDSTALTKEQQEELDRHKVRVLTVLVRIIIVVVRTEPLLLSAHRYHDHVQQHTMRVVSSHYTICVCFVIRSS